MSIDALNDIHIGGKWVKLKNKGDRVAGKLVSADRRERRDMSGNVVYKRGTQTPRLEIILTLQVTPESPDDDGVRKVACNEAMQAALAAAKPAGGFVPGGELVLGCVEDAPDTMSQARYAAKFTAPAASTAALDDLL